MFNFENTYVLIRTQEEYEKILEEAREQGYKWHGEKGTSIIENFIKAPDRTKITDGFVDCLKFAADKLKEVSK